MGSVPTIAHDRYPKQTGRVGKRTTVAFHYDLNHQLPAEILRDDAEAPFETLLRLDDGRIVRAQECQWAWVEAASAAAAAIARNVTHRGRLVWRADSAFPDEQAACGGSALDGIALLDTPVTCPACLALKETA